ncbi:hypothetical protein ACLOJK_017811 [Asimina triloba]
MDVFRGNKQSAGRAHGIGLTERTRVKYMEIGMGGKSEGGWERLSVEFPGVLVLLEEGVEKYEAVPFGKAVPHLRPFTFRTRTSRLLAETGRGRARGDH